ncbi:hypothetical protein Aperf_G00000036311 [Anoplocephala perfoliata]
MDRLTVTKNLTHRMNEVLTSEAAEKERIFNDFLSSSGFGSTPYRDSIDKKVDTLSLYMLKLENCDKKPQSLRQSSASFKSGSCSLIHESNQLRSLSEDFDSLLSRLQSLSSSFERISKLPQLLDEVKGVEMEILSDAAKNFESEIPMSPTKPSALPDYLNVPIVGNLQSEVARLQTQVNQLQDDLRHFGDIGTDLDIAYKDVLNTEAMLSQLQKENDLANGFSGWK